MFIDNLDIKIKGSRKDAINNMHKELEIDFNGISAPLIYSVIEVGKYP